MSCSEYCPGWDVFETQEGHQLQSCDECGRFASDDEAAAHVGKLLRELNNTSELVRVMNSGLR